MSAGALVSFMLYQQSLNAAFQVGPMLSPTCARQAFIDAL